MARRLPKPFFAVILSTALLLIACGSDGSATTAPTSSTGDTLVGEEVSEDPIEAIPAVDEPTTTSTTSVASTIGEPDEPIDPDVTPCVAPVDTELYVDVALDDPDGGLNMRTAPGVENDIIGVFPRSSALITSGDCATLGTFDWWRVENVEGSLEGWVSSRFLSELPVFNPGLGIAIEDLDNVGASAESLEGLALVIAESYGFDDDATITMTSEDPVIDAQGGMAVFEMTGLKDDASNGYVVEIDFIFDKDEAADGEIVSYTATKVTNYSMCSRGVTEDGLCT